MSRFLFQCSPADRSFLPLLKGVLSGSTVYLRDETPLTLFEVAAEAKKKQVDAVICTNEVLLHKLLEGKKGSLDDYAGSIIEKFGIDFLVLNPVEHLVTVPYGRHLYERYLSKITRPENWFKYPQFSWTLADADNLQALYKQFSTADYIAVDIETTKTNLAITCSGYCGIWIDPVTRRYAVHSIVIPCTSDYFLAWIRKFNALQIPKIFQNGKYDNAYFCRFASPVSHWLFDTQHLFHSWYSELPKRLDFITSYTLRKWQYWKDEAQTLNQKEYYAYNAKDTFGTAISFLALIAEMPQWALENYLQEFPLVFPCHLAEMTGIKKDAAIFEEFKNEFTKITDEEKAALGRTIGKNFNPQSPSQVLRLMHALGSKDIKNTTPPSRDRFAHRHPLNRFLIDRIAKYRKNNKIRTSYLKDGIDLGGRIIYSLNPHGTDTARLASKEHHFWCGLQIQNIPRDKEETEETIKVELKKGFIADEGFDLGEGDYEQAETRDTAYISGDKNLIAVVEDASKDFHSYNTSKFFGVSYESVCNSRMESGEWKHSRLNKPLIDIAKRTNHGANYNMQEGMMLDTMGIEKVLRAKQLLNLPARYKLKDVTRYLLDQFAATYPGIKVDYYNWVKATVSATRMLTGATGWTRYCFGQLANKFYFNSLVAHNPQSLNACTLNKAWLNVFYQVWLPNPTAFKMHAQVHDSILFSYTTGRTDLVDLVGSAMVIPTVVTDVHGIKRTLIVPVKIKCGGKRWSDIKTYRTFH